MVEPSSMLGPIDLLAPVIQHVVLVLVLANMVTRMLQHRRHQQAVESGAETLSRFLPHVASNVLLVLATFYFLTVDYHGGIVLSILVLTLLIVDFFEFESRVVELRSGNELEPPRAAIAASGLVLLYAFYVSLFFVLRPAWEIVF